LAISGGLFISFEGIDGVGKSTQADRMDSYLAAKGLSVVRTLEPGGTDLGVEIRHLLLHRKGEVSARSEALLYAADRAHHVASKIAPALKAGQVVITDRYLDSSVAYQGAGRELDLTEVRNLSLWAVNNLLPDLTVLLDLDAELAAQRRDQTGKEPDRLEREKIEFFEAARNSYLELAKSEPKRFFVVDANQQPDEIWSAIQLRLDEVLESKGL
jgi:dTMP kinase